MSEEVLSIRGLRKRFGQFEAVKGISFSVNQGEILGFLGPNGAGKTTTINMLCGLLKPDAGEIAMFGRPISTGDGSARSRLGMCPQENVLWDKLTCREQLIFTASMYGIGGREASRRSDELLDRLDLRAQGNRLGATLSGGMRRRLSLALALVHDPDIVVLDEPEAGLDPVTRVSMREFVRSLAGRKTVVLTTHNLDEADRLSDRVAIIDAGRLLVVDTPEALKKSIGVGDVLELDLANGANPGRVQQALGGTVHPDCVKLRGSTLSIQVLDAVERLPAIHESLRSAGFVPHGIRLRGATLEDVFLSLTGRGLQA